MTISCPRPECPPQQGAFTILVIGKLWPLKIIVVHLIAAFFIASYGTGITTGVLTIRIELRYVLAGVRYRDCIYVATYQGSRNQTF